MTKVLLASVLIIGLAAGCSKDKAAEKEYWPEGTIESCDKSNNLYIPTKCKSSIIKEGLVYVENGAKKLYGGENKSWDFDITNWCLNECQLHYGLGRENFPALIYPAYGTIAANESYYDDEDRFMIVEEGSAPKVYSIDLMRRHEIINDTTATGEPFMVGYCVLADLAAVYTRVYCGKTFTFAVSGYTYFDSQVWDGLDGFILWDRNTESLWWPLIDKAVSGPMKGTLLEKFDETKWRETTWGQIKADHPTAMVMEQGQTMNIPTNIPILLCP